MSGSTTELNLKTAVDADDTADYLTLSLADSLRTVDALYNNVTGHTHNGAHQGGPIGAIGAGAIPDGLITSAKIADGTIATADLANAAVTNAKLASDTARANLLTNGGFEIWQRGNGAVNTNTAYSADRWRVRIGGTSTLAVTQETSFVDRSKYSARLLYTHAASGFGFIEQIVEIDQLKGRTISLSVRTMANTAVGAVATIATDGAVPLTATSPPSAGLSWETLGVSGIVPSDATLLFIRLQAPSASTTVWFDNAMLVTGSVAADYAPLHPADDLARCLRYFEITGYAVSNPIANGQAYSATAAVVTLPFLPKAVTPTVTYSALSGFGLTSANYAVNNCTAISTNALGGRTLAIAANVASGLVAGNATVLLVPAGNTATISLEANP